MKFIVPILLIALQLIESTAGRCRLQATVRTEEVETNPGERPEMVHQTQLQLLCSNMSCPMTNFTCDTYTDLDIPRDCMDEDCSRTFNLCGSICTTVRQDQSIELPTAPNPQAKTDSVMMKPINACPTNTSCTPITITSCTTVSANSTVSTIEQSCFKVTSVTISTVATVTQEKTLTITHIITPIPWTTQCPQITTELMTTTTTNEKENMPCTPITSTKFIATTVLPPLQSCAPQFTTTPMLNITKSSTTSFGLESYSGNKSGNMLTQRNGLSNTISALGALLGFSLVLLALVTTGWVWTCWTARKREVNINSRTNNINAPNMSLDINPAYEAQSPLQRNPAYEDTTLQSQSAGELQSSSTQDPTYEIIPPAASGNTITAQTQRSGEDGDEYNRLNREPPNTQ